MWLNARWEGLKNDSGSHDNTFRQVDFYTLVFMKEGELFSPEILITEAQGDTTSKLNPIQVLAHPFACTETDADNPVWLTTAEPISFSDIINEGIYKATLTGKSFGTDSSEWEAVYRFEVLNQ